MSDLPTEPGGPKNEHSIRQALNKIRAGADVSTPAGPHAGGVSPGHPVLIAAFVDRDVARKFQRILLDNEIDPNVAVVGKSRKVSVDAKDAKRATAIYLECKERLADGKFSRNPGRHDWLFFCSLIGLVLGVVFGISVANMRVVPVNDASYERSNREVRESTPGQRLAKIRFLAAKSTLLIVGLVVISGHLVDRLRMKKRKGFDRRRIGMWEFFCLTAVLFMTLSLVQTIVDLMPRVSFI